jgi:hypothetical protein
VLVGVCFFLFVVGKVGCGFCPGFVSFSFLFFGELLSNLCFVFVCFLSLVCLSSFLVCVFVGGGEEFSKLFLCSCGKEIFLGLSYRLKDTRSL